MKYLINIYRFFLSLRYKVEIKGIDVLKTNSAKLILPNHQAIIDPQLLVTYIYKYAKVIPVATERYFQNPLLKKILNAFDAVPVNDLLAGSRDQEVLNTIYANVINALFSGKNVLLYPAGQIAGQGYEKIFNKQSAWAVVNHLPDNTNVIGVRISGLWGSMWSRAWIGRTPAFFKTFLKAVFYVFANFIFFVPKRKVTVELIDLTGQARAKSKEGRLNFNIFLENFYNENGEEKVLFLKHFFYVPAINRNLPEHIEWSVKDMQKTNTILYTDITDIVFLDIVKILATETKIKESEIKLESNLSLELNIDSLMLVVIISEIEKQFSVSPQFEITQIRTVADLCLLAMGKGIDEEVLKPATLDISALPFKKLEIDPSKNIVDLFFDVFGKYKNESFAYDKTLGSTTRKDFLLKANVVAQIIKKEVDGQHVGIMLPSLQSTTLLVISTYLAGKIPVMLNWTVGKKMLDHCVNSVEIKQILTVKKFYDKIEELLSDEVKQKCIFFEQKVKTLSISTKLNGLLHYLLKLKPVINLNDIAVILFTSGSESFPKAVPLTHKNIVSDLWGVFHNVPIYSDYKLLAFLPPFHSFGFTVLTIMPLVTGVKVAYTPDPTDGREVLKIVQHTKANVLLATPTFLKMMLSLVKRDELSHIILALTGAESLHSSVIEMFKQKTNSNAKIIEGYGITECAPVLSINLMDRQKVKSVGKIIMGVEAIVTDINSYKLLPKGLEGMILVKGDNIFNGYLDKKIESPFVIVNNKTYYKTGDLGYFDNDDFLFITGRLKRFIKIAGEMISLPAIENTLLIKFGNPDKTVLAVEGNDTLEPPRIVLFSTIEINLDEVNLFLKTSGFSNLVKIHRIVKIDEIPLLGTGKTDYKVLKEKTAL